MTKARARERAKAKAAQKVQKRKANAERLADTIKPGHFDPGAGSIKSLRSNYTANFSRTKRGSARGG